MITKLNCLALGGALLAATLATPMTAMAAPATDALVAGNTAFALDLYAQLKAADGNLFFSPYSISSCLAMTYTGASGDTATNMAAVLHFDSDPAKLAAAFGALQKELARSQSRSGVELNLANGLWGQRGHPFLKTFLDLAHNDFSANLNQVDFRTGAEPARLQINDWVSDRTKGKIKELLPPGVPDQSTRLVLVNAIYFKGQWAEQFLKGNTQIEPFHVTPTEDVQSPLMNLEKPFKYAETDTYQLLELPYKSGALSMVILLPREIDGLKKLEASLDGPALNQQIASARKQKVTVFLPKFKITAQFSLVKTLMALGMTTPFVRGADFSGMDGERDLFISAVLHKAYVDLDEEGTEAAAATGAVVSLSMAMPVRQPIPIFRADHPFIFFIRDTQTGAILFLGRINDPTKQ